MTESEQLADFIVRASYEDLSDQARLQLKIRVIDSLGCAIGAMEGQPIRCIRTHLNEFGGNNLCTVIGGKKTAPDLAALYNCSLVRYLDFNDSYLAKGETCHPSDNIGAVLAATEYANGNGSDFLTALAISYQVQCRLSDVAPVRHKGFDHTVQGSYSLASGIAKALNLDFDRTVNAIGICGTAFNALRVTRTGSLSNWKGLAMPNTAFCCMHGTFLAMRGITGPREVFEGNKGFMDSISGEFEIDWPREDLERVKKTAIKKYNAEMHSQSAIEGVLEIKRENGITHKEIKQIGVDIFDVAYHIIGGGEEGDKTIVRTKEEADHSLQYMIAVALIDDQVMPSQYEAGRIVSQDVQDLLKKVVVRPVKKYTDLFPEQHACKITITLEDGRILEKEKKDYEGFVTNPMGWEGVVNKFEILSKPYTENNLRAKLVDTIANLDEIEISELCRLISKIETPQKN
jgi:2-methylcitrate dehydratase